MGTQTRSMLKGKIRDSYLGLIQEYPLSSIRSEQQLDEAQAAVDRLVARGDLDEGEEMYLDALTDLIGVYEDQHHEIGAASDADLLRHLLDARGLTQAELSQQSGIAKSTISEILSGKKPFSRMIVRKLAEFFRVDVSILTGNL
jgi:HTH-type transcriptional regulator/antitoxin HigA